MSGKKNTLTSAKVMPPLPISQGWMGWNLTGHWRYFDPIHEDHLSPCNHACSAGGDVQRFISLIDDKKFREAYDAIRQTNPLPAICGRVCNHPCEANCNRRELDDAISIRCLERFIGDWGLKNVKTQPAEFDPQLGEVAVVGGGPAGLSAAWRLTNLGYRVTLFESQTKLGGMMRAGIAEYTLPRKILDAEIHSLIDRGIEVCVGTKIGTDMLLEDLSRFRAILITTGADKPRDLEIPGAELPQVQQGLTFLSDVSKGHRDHVPGEVAIVGGNNTAITCARTVLRLGGKPVVYFRRSLAEMPAFADLIEEARQEDIEIHLLTAPVVIRKAGDNLQITLQRLMFGKKDSSGQRVTVSIHGSQFEQNVSLVLVALGEDPDLSFLPKDIECQSWGLNTGGTHQTSIKNIFAAGDCSDGHKGVGSAIGSGMSAANAIDRYLRGMNIFVEAKPQIVTRPSDINIAYFPRSQVVEWKRIPVNRRTTTFAEIHLGLSEPEVMREAARCFSCGVCDHCDNCLTFCPEHAVSRTNDEYAIDYDYCKGCGICIHECPRDAIHLRLRQVPR